ncbi:MAG: hypothetical protein ACRDQ5_09520, partial [Sciscionella sp.]
MADSQAITYTIEWESAPGVRGDEHRATWARFEFWVEGECATQVEDKENGSARRSIYVSLYPLAEWIAFNWWLLSYDYRSTWTVEKSRVRDTLYRQRVWSEIRPHRVREAGDGFVWPDLAILPQDNGQTLLVWRSDQSAQEGWATRFISNGSKRVSSREVLLVLSSIVEKVIHRLREQGIGKSSLMEEWERVSSPDEAERDFCVAAARLGLDPYSDEAISLEDGIIRAASSLSGEVLTDFLGVARPSAINEEIDWVLSSADLARQPNVDAINPLPKLADTELNYTTSPWRIGWKEASSLRDKLDISPTDPVQMESWIHTDSRPTLNAGMQALGFAEGSSIGRLVLAKSYMSKVRRFTEARALWHLAHSPSGIFLVVATYGDRQKIERAFAAEFLAPAEGIR